MGSAADSRGDSQGVRHLVMARDFRHLVMGTPRHGPIGGLQYARRDCAGMGQGARRADGTASAAGASEDQSPSQGPQRLSAGAIDGQEQLSGNAEAKPGS